MGRYRHRDLPAACPADGAGRGDAHERDGERRGGCGRVRVAAYSAGGHVDGRCSGRKSVSRARGRRQCPCRAAEVSCIHERLGILEEAELDGNRVRDVGVYRGRTAPQGRDVTCIEAEAIAIEHTDAHHGWLAARVIVGHAKRRTKTPLAGDVDGRDGRPAPG